MWNRNLFTKLTEHLLEASLRFQVCRSFISNIWSNWTGEPLDQRGLHQVQFSLRARWAALWMRRHLWRPHPARQDPQQPSKLSKAALWAHWLHSRTIPTTSDRTTRWSWKLKPLFTPRVYFPAADRLQRPHDAGSGSDFSCCSSDEIHSTWSTVSRTGRYHVSGCRWTEAKTQIKDVSSCSDPGRRL